MPITQYSRIQLRRGLLADLPTLNTSEIGHALDAKRVFIGNGTVEEGAPNTGNTEIITEFSVLNSPAALKTTYRSNTAVEAITGVDANTPVVRGLQQVLDDRVSIKDYGAFGDGDSDDTVAINRALQDLYCRDGNQERARRVLFFPAGTYIITSPIFLPPYVTIEGEGIENTVILQVNGNATCVCNTADGFFQTNSNIGVEGATLPTNITIRDMTLRHLGDQNVLTLERANKVFCERVSFIGNYDGNQIAAIYVDNLEVSESYDRYTFKDCYFRGMYKVFSADALGTYITNVLFDSCTIEYVPYGIYTTGAIVNLVVNKCTFYSVSVCLYANSNSENIKSSHNFFNSCGNGSPIIFFDVGSTNCSSINDTFKSCSAPYITDSTTGSIVIAPNRQNKMGNVTTTVLNTYGITLTAGSVNSNTALDIGDSRTSFDYTKFNSLFIDYTLKRDSDFRIGTLKILTNGTTAIIDDNFTDTNDLGVEFSVSVDSGSSSLFVNYTCTAGSNATWYPVVRSFLTSL